MQQKATPAIVVVAIVILLVIVVAIWYFTMGKGPKGDAQPEEAGPADNAGMAVGDQAQPGGSEGTDPSLMAPAADGG